MQDANVYTYLTPIAIFFVLIEVALCYIYRRDYVSFPEAVANFGTALGNQTVNVLVAAGVYVVYGYLWENYRIWTFEMQWWSFILLLLGVDFIFYWVHRWGHAINIMWAAHSPHHSAEEMNFMVALRASVTQRFCSFLFFWPLALIGFPPFYIYMIAGIHLFIAFLHHTEFIGKLGWFEKYFTTPSHHRVHHGVNFPYLDKNFGEFLIIWDKIRVWFMPAGWRPRGLPQKEMIEITTENQVKFRSTMFGRSHLYLVVQLAVGVFLMLGVISNLLAWNLTQRWLGAGLLWWHIINWSGILEAKSWLWISENLRVITTLCAVIVFNQLYQPSPLLIAAVAVSVFSFIWTNLYFRPSSPKLAPA